MIAENIKVGMVSIFPSDTLEKDDRYLGTIIYVHPKKYFYTVELELPNGCKIRESYIFPSKKVCACERGAYNIKREDFHVKSCRFF